MWSALSSKTQLAPVIGPPLPQDDAWDVVERFAREVGHNRGASEQLRATLRAMRDAIHADVAYWHPGVSDEQPELLGGGGLPAEWCRTFVQKLLAETAGGEGRLLRSALPPSGDPSRPTPRSAAMVRVSRSRASWLVALNFAPSPTFRVADLKILAVIRQVLVNQRRAEGMFERCADTLHWLVQCLATSIDSKLPYAPGHSERVGQAAMIIGQQMHLPRPVLSDLYFAGLLHDIGLTGIRETLLSKPGPLTDDELAEVRQAPLVGDRILAGIRQLDHLRPAVRSHRERYDGRGYPDGLAGENIPLMARILAVAEGFDALNSPRPHRPARNSTQSADIIIAGAGRRWDPRLVEHFKACRPALGKLYGTGKVIGPEPAVGTAVEVWDVNSSRVPVAREGQPGAECTAVPAGKGSGGWLWNASETDGPSARG
jgi:HD-GYP domain-containing protein (c-di-GMP phosphodiesterase class II)